MNLKTLPDTSDSNSLATLIARRAVPVGCVLGLAFGGSAIAQTNPGEPGTRLAGEFQVNTETAVNQRNPAIARDADGDFVVAWQSYGQDGSGDGIYAQRYNADGSAAGGEFLVNTETSGNQFGPAIALDVDGDFVVAWQSVGQDGSGDGIYA